MRAIRARRAGRASWCRPRTPATCARDAALAEQAAFENQRRWLSLDLLAGRVGRAASAVALSARRGRPTAELDALRRAPGAAGRSSACNYYVTSDRFLDERLDRYPRARRTAATARSATPTSRRCACRRSACAATPSVLLEAWQRYRLPVAITEAHIGCTREEQMRWLVEAWQGAHARARRAAPTSARSPPGRCSGRGTGTRLLTRDAASHYEPGAFDVRDRRRGRPTALAGRWPRSRPPAATPAHPGARARPGWWRRGHAAPPAVDARADPRSPAPTARSAGRSSAPATRAACRASRCRARELDIADPDAVRAALDALAAVGDRQRRRLRARGRGRARRARAAGATNARRAGGAGRGLPRGGAFSS